MTGMAPILKHTSLTKPLNTLLTAILIGLSSCLLLLPAHAELPTLGDPTRQSFSPFNEYLMGKQFYMTLRANVSFVEDLEVNDYVTTLGQQLVSHTDHVDRDFKFFVININSINAFAGPDAYLGFHSGLILAARNESEFAGVMAHEISHVTQRHLARALTESNTNPATMFATILAGILLASQNPDAGAALIYGGQAALIQSQINFTRSNEHEADRIGIRILQEAGINPEGMASFFETLLKNTDSNNLLSQMEYLRTHPLNSTRVAEARNRISEESRSLRDDSLDFQLMRSRILLRSHKDPAQLVKQLAEHGEEGIVNDYTLGLAYTANRQFDKAIEKLTQLSQLEDHPWVKLALADAYLAGNKPKHNLQLLQQLNALYPNYLPVSIRYARALIDNQQADQAILLLNQQLKSRKEAVVYQTLARAYFIENNIALALEATSHEYQQTGYLKQAVQQIENALQQSDLAPLTRQRLESRKQDLMLQIRKESRI
jgi:predicted Zn-dependent protease